MKKEYEVDVIKLRKIMAENEIITSKELAENADIDKSTISLILHKKRRPSTVVIEKLMKALFISTDDAGEIFFKEKLT